MKDKYHFVAISGSLRAASFNTMVLKTLQKIAPANIVIDHLSIAEIPLFNQDIHHDDQFPEHAYKLSESIKKADAVIIISPEYNYSIPGVLKNTLDMLSRLPEQPFNMKAVGLVGASPGTLGTARAQYHLRQVMVTLNAYVMNRPEVMIAQAHTKFDKDGNLTDEKTKEFLGKFLNELVKFSDKFI